MAELLELELELLELELELELELLDDLDLDPPDLLLDDLLSGEPGLEETLLS